MCVRASRRWRSQEEEEEERKNPRITKESLRRICKEQKLYITPHLNDVLYLHYKGYSKIENLEEYTGLKCLWLENNGIDRIENLNCQKDLRNLYLHNNLIKEIENLEGACPLLDSLNLCHNSVSKIQNLSKLEHLHTLHISHNRLQDFADVEHLKNCKELSCVDLQHNWLDDPNIVDIFEAMPSLRVLYLTGNPVIKKIPHYRKNLTVRCKKLTYLDDRPVFPKDRAAAEAWSEGGLDAEKVCRQKWAEEERAKIDASVKGLLALRDKAKAAKYKEEMEKLELEMASEKDEEEEEEEEEEIEEEDEPEPVNDNLEAGDSEEITHNGIIFPWNLDQDSRTRTRNEMGEGGRSLIVELPDPNQSETKQVNSVSRKTLKDPEMKNKLHEALLSAEWLQDNSDGVKPEEGKAEIKTENIPTATEEFKEKVEEEEETKERQQSERETKKKEELEETGMRVNERLSEKMEETEEEDDEPLIKTEEMEAKMKGEEKEPETMMKEKEVTDAKMKDKEEQKTAIKEKEVMTVDAMMNKSEKAQEKTEENKTLSKEIEDTELVMEEKETITQKMEEKEKEEETETVENTISHLYPTSEALKDILEKKTVKEILEDLDEIEKGTLDNLIKEKELSYERYMKKTEEEILPNISHFEFGRTPPEQQEKSLSEEIEDFLRIEKEEMEKTKQEEQNKLKNKFIQEKTIEKTNFLRTEVDDIIKTAVTMLGEKELINEEQANHVLDNGVKVIQQLNNIGNFPLLPAEESSDDEFHDVEEPESQQFPAFVPTGRNKLELQESEEFYSFVEESEEREEDRPEVEDTCPDTYRKNITSSIELQIVAEEHQD